jgi:hypothetical protein
MYTMILCAALAAIIVVLIAARKCGIGMAIYYAAMASMLGLVIGLIASMIIEATLVPMVDNVYGPARLVAVRSSEGVSGAFIWGSGSISSDTYYNFYMAEPDGSFAPEQVPASSVVRIIEDASLKDEGFWTTTIREPDTKSPFYRWGFVNDPRTETLRQEFRVPKGTVVQSFNITR